MKAKSQAPCALVELDPIQPTVSEMQHKVEHFIQRTPEFYRHIAKRAEDMELVRACLLLAAHDIERWRASCEG